METQKIIRFREKAKRILTVIMSIMFFQAEFFHISQLILHFTGSVRDFCLLLYTPITYAYLCHSALFTRYYFVYTSRYVSIQQSVMLTNLMKLSRQIGSGGGSYHSSSQQQLLFTATKSSSCHLAQFRHLYQQMTQLHEQIEAHDALWRPILSCYFAVYIVEVCYYTYIFIFLSEISVQSEYKSFFTVFPLDFASTLLFMTFECSMVVRKNGQILQMLRRISYQLMRDCSRPSDVHHLLLVRKCSSLIPS